MLMLYLTCGSICEPGSPDLPVLRVAADGYVTWLATQSWKVEHGC